MDKVFTIQKIKNGTVIDHIPCGMVLKVLKILNIEGNIGSTVSVAMHVISKKNECKDILKVEDKFLDGKEVDKIGLIASKATINIIKDFKVVVKHKVSLPDEIGGIVKCANPNCITNKKEPIVGMFYVVSQKPVTLKCRYCEREMEHIDVVNNIL